MNCVPCQQGKHEECLQSTAQCTCECEQKRAMDFQLNLLDQKNSAAHIRATLQRRLSHLGIPIRRRRRSK